MRKQSRRTWLTILTAIVVLLPLLYVASFGPACWAVEHAFLSVETVAASYEPLLASDAVDSYLRAYGKLFSDPLTVHDIWVDARMSRQMLEEQQRPLGATDPSR